MKKKRKKKKEGLNLKFECLGTRLAQHLHWLQIHESSIAYYLLRVSQNKSITTCKLTAVMPLALSQFHVGRFGYETIWQPRLHSDRTVNNLEYEVETREGLDSSF